MGQAIAIRGGPSATAGSAGLLRLAIPGILAIGTNIAPLGFYTSAMPLSQASVALKGAPAGASISFEIYAGATLLWTVTVSASGTTGSATGAVTVPANTLITVNLTAAGGNTYLGNDATIIIQ